MVQWWWQVEESTGQPAKAAGRTGGRASRAANLSSAGPSSPAASRDSGAGKQGPVANLYAASSQRYLDTGSSYTQVPPPLTACTSVKALHVSGRMHYLLSQKPCTACITQFCKRHVLSIHELFMFGPWSELGYIDQHRLT